ncbi:hypothetical protein D6855_04415 [Butyrivibrio sp. CB08]|nr:hypothetical protein D6855_04415 [Butyrivibrio sp. CB08]
MNVIYAYMSIDEALVICGAGTETLILWGTESVVAKELPLPPPMPCIDAFFASSCFIIFLRYSVLSLF